ncbi:leucyl aminopeptidase [Patescibacteria group bacterium]|nr:MAG: leucyl aminopeptidase [Patescibacteria group bacterium]
MKNLSRVPRFSYESKNLAEISADVLILPLFDNEKLPKELTDFDKKINNAVKNILDAKDFSGKKNSVLLFHSSGKAKRILLIGLGENKKISMETIRASISNGISALKNISAAKAAIRLSGLDSFASEDLGQAVVETVLLSLYEFTQYKKTDEKKKSYLKEICLLADKKDLSEIKKGGETGEKIARAVILARDLANEPANVVTPATLAEEAVKMAKLNGIKHKILEIKDMKRLGMGALLGVAKGSEEPAKFIILEYKPKLKVKSEELKVQTIVLVGKGITFDSGGISIKPSQSMDEMKYDMAGGATVIGAMQAAAQLILPINLIGLIPSTENLPSGTAQRPGDIVRAMNGKTIEVLNTDAEGRMILADALVYAKKYNPDAVIDFATLTGAIVVAIGEHASGLFSNNENLEKNLKKAGEATGERVWPMPLYEEYFEQIKGDLADIRNIGGKEGGPSTAAKFLEQFTDFPWAHLDIAGTAWTTKPKPYRPKGATGVGVRLIIETLINWE